MGTGNGNGDVHETAGDVLDNMLSGIDGIDVTVRKLAQEAWCEVVKEKIKALILKDDTKRLDKLALLAKECEYGAVSTVLDMRNYYSSFRNKISELYPVQKANIENF